MAIAPRTTLEPTPDRVVVTGAGIITALGVGWPANAEGFRNGRPGFRPVTLFDVSRHRARCAAEVDLPPGLPVSCLSRRIERRLTRSGRLLIWAGAEAWSQSGWTTGDGVPVVLGTTGCGMESGESFILHERAENPSARHQPTRALAHQGQRQALDLCEALGLSGPITLISNACASGANAIGHAWELIQSGLSERVLCGGYDALSRTVFAGFDSLQALTTTICRPFDTGRDGLALGEGAAILALESLTMARQRGATILGEIIGYGAATDLHHLTQPHPHGDAALSTMQEACRWAAIQSGDVSYINAHGTGTLLNDSAEAQAIQRWAGPDSERVPVSSTKACIGHLLGAAGAVEAVVCLMTLREQWLPPEIVVERVDPLCRFPLVREPTRARVEVVLSNSFGFGGSNATLAFRRCPSIPCT